MTAPRKSTPPAPVAPAASAGRRHGSDVHQSHAVDPGYAERVATHIAEADKEAAEKAKYTKPVADKKIVRHLEDGYAIITMNLANSRNTGELTRAEQNAVLVAAMREVSDLPESAREAFAQSAVEMLAADPHDMTALWEQAREGAISIAGDLIGTGFEFAIPEDTRSTEDDVNAIPRM